MSNVIEAFPRAEEPVTRPHVDFFEVIEHHTRLPRYAPTIQVREAGNGTFTALNPDAELLALFERGDRKKPFSLKLLRLMADFRFNVEVVRGA